MSLRQTQLTLLIRTGLLEMKRRQDLQVLSILMGLYLLMALGVRTLSERNADTDAFILNLGLTLSSFFGLVLTALTGLRQMPEDIEQRSIYPLLARPLDRTTLLTGRFLTAALSGLLVTGLFLSLTLLVCPIPQALQVGMLVQFTFFQALAILWAAAFALLFGLCLPQMLASVLCLALLFGGEVLFRMLPDTFVFKALFPRFGSLQLTNRVTGGSPPLTSAEWIPLVLYALVWIAFCHLSASALFRRRAL